ncbi:MAG: glycosyltransferase family 2 protein [Desulfuromonas sp.]
MNNSCAVIVTYNPDIPTLKACINATATQVDKIYVVDNASSISFEDCLAGYAAVETICLAENMGIAAGFNVGIRRAREAGYRYLLFLDQDSIPPPNLVEKYLDTFEHLHSNAQPVAALGPRYRDPRNGHTSNFVRFSWFRNRYIKLESGNDHVKADFLISSGSFYPIEIFDKVGLFEEDLFIDHVDTEWFLRAKALGYTCIGVWDAVMEHCLGEGSIRMWFLRWRDHPLHKPFRLYFITRNSLLLYRKDHVPLKFISADILRLMRLFVVHICFSSERKDVLRWSALGVWHGIKGISGCTAVFPGSEDAKPESV